MAGHGGTSSRELFILGVISCGPTHGHQVMQTLAVSEARRWVELSDKHVYYVLRKLQSVGWITCSAEGRRQVYTITEAGRAALSAMLRDPGLAVSRAYEPFDTVLATLGATSVLSADESVAVLEERLAALERRRAEEHRDLDEDAVMERFGGAAWALATRTRRLLDAEIAWLEDVLRRVEERGWEAMQVPDAVRPR